jgi:hypothetical protein
MTEQEYRIALGAYVLGALDLDETKDIEVHLHTCAGCQLEYLELAQTLGALGTVSPDVAAAGLTGQPLPLPAFPLTPPTAEADPGRRRVIRPTGGAHPTGAPQPGPGRPPGPPRCDGTGGGVARGIGARPGRRRPAGSGRAQTWRALVGVTTIVAVIVAITLGTTVRMHRPTGAGTPLAVRSTELPPQPRTVTGHSQATGVTAVITLHPEPGGTRLDARVTGQLQAGWQCRLVAVPATGDTESAGSSRVTVPSDGVHLDGPVALPVEAISRVEIQKADGQVLVSVPL